MKHLVCLAIVVALGLWVGFSTEAQIPREGGLGCPNANPKIVPTNCPTIQEAVNESRPGDTIIILPGTYQESVKVENKREVIIEAQEPGTVTVKPQSSSEHVFTYRNSQKWTMRKGIILTGGARGIEINNSTEIVLLDLVITKNQA